MTAYVIGWRIPSVAQDPWNVAHSDLLHDDKCSTEPPLACVCVCGVLRCIGGGGLKAVDTVGFHLITRVEPFDLPGDTVRSAAKARLAFDDDMHRVCSVAPILDLVADIYDRLWLVMTPSDGERVRVVCDQDTNFRSTDEYAIEASEAFFLVPHIVLRVLGSNWSDASSEDQGCHMCYTARRLRALVRPGHRKH